MIEYRRSKFEDVEGIIHVNIETWKTTYHGIISAETLESLDSNKQARIDKFKEEFGKRSVGNKPIEQYVALEDNKVVGFVNYGCNRDIDNVKGEGIAEIYAIYVLKGYQKKGIGKELVRLAVRDLANDPSYKKLVIWTLKDNPSRGFYERIGGIKTFDKKILIGDQSLDEVGYLYNHLSEIF